MSSMGKRMQVGLQNGEIHFEGTLSQGDPRDHAWASNSSPIEKLDCDEQ